MMIGHVQSLKSQCILNEKKSSMKTTKKQNKQAGILFDGKKNQTGKEKSGY